MPTSMKITGLVPWFGSKRTLAPLIARELGSHQAYWEPFCGSCAVLFAKPPCAQETVNDLHGDLVNLAMVLASDRWRSLYKGLSRVLYAEPVFDAAKRRCTLDEAVAPPESPSHVCRLHVERAYWYVLMSWMGRNGTAGTKPVNLSMATRWTANGGSGATRLAAAIDSMPAWHERLRHVMILRRDAFELVERIDDASGTALYVDPPYLKETRGDHGGSRYEHDFADADHERLAQALRRFRRARVVVSYYDHPRVRELYPDWTVVRCDRHKHLAAQSRRGSTREEAPEILLINGPRNRDGCPLLRDLE
jgi:DNA adenine methylase